MIHHSSLNPTIKKFRPVYDRILLRRHKRPEEVGGILMPHNARFTDLAKFDVIACGGQCKQVSPGDTAFAPTQLAFAKVNVNGEELEVAPESVMSMFQTAR